MRCLALVTDYDDTLANFGRVDDDTINYLERLAASGRHLILVTGRHLADLVAVFPRIDLFERVVCENGALIYRPSTGEERVLADAPSSKLIKELQRRHVTPLSYARCIVDTERPNETTVVETIRDLGLELQVVFNKKAVMILPSGINKRSGLLEALEEIGLSPHNVVGIGDAENDHSFLSICEASFAVRNALPAIKSEVDVITKNEKGAAVCELIEHILRNDLSDLRLKRHDLVLGTNAGDSTSITCNPHSTVILVAGPSGAGKSTAVMGVLEKLSNAKFQFCIIDPEGDYKPFDNAVILGDSTAAPTTEEVLQLLRSPSQNAIVNLLGCQLSDRPAFFASLLPLLQNLRATTGRPHWIVVDEAHHTLPSEWESVTQFFPQNVGSFIFVTVHPDKVSSSALDLVDIVIAIGDEPEETMKRLTGKAAQIFDNKQYKLNEGQALVWFRRKKVDPIVVNMSKSKLEFSRHRRKYADGELAPERCFYFRGPDSKLKLKAQNLFIFTQIAEGVDDETWLHHLHNHDYSRWFKEMIKDEELSMAAEKIERDDSLSPDESRRQIKELVHFRYTRSA